MSSEPLLSAVSDVEPAPGSVSDVPIRDESKGPLSGDDAMRILSALPIAVVVVDREGTVALANTRASEILRRPISDIEHHRLDPLLAPIASVLERNEARGSHDPRFSRTLQIAGEPPVTIGYSVARVPDAHDALAVAFQDVSSWAKLREEHDRLLQLAAVGEVLPSILHELKNPLAAVTSAVEVLVEELPDGSVREQLHAVLSEVRRMKLGFEGVGAVGRGLRSGRCAAIDLALREVFSILAPRASNAGVIARCDVPDMPLLPLDPSVVRAIAFNLMVNAIHASFEGSTIVVHARIVDEDRAFELTVADTGTGMSAAVYRRCTELFFTTKRSGSGIGLALVTKAIEEAGGTLTIQSVPGVGTTITVRVPINAQTSVGR